MNRTLAALALVLGAVGANAAEALAPRPQAIRMVFSALAPVLADCDVIPFVIGGDFNSFSHRLPVFCRIPREGRGGGDRRRAVSQAVHLARTRILGFSVGSRGVGRDL